MNGGGGGGNEGTRRKRKATTAAAAAAAGAEAAALKSKAVEEEARLTEMIFLRDLHFGFLPDDCETEFAGCFRKLSEDAKFATKVSL